MTRGGSECALEGDARRIEKIGEESSWLPKSTKSCSLEKQDEKELIIIRPEEVEAEIIAMERNLIITKTIGTKFKWDLDERDR